MSRQVTVGFFAFFCVLGDWMIRWPKTTISLNRRTSLAEEIVTTQCCFFPTKRSLSSVIPEKRSGIVKKSIQREGAQSLRGEVIFH